LELTITLPASAQERIAITGANERNLKIIRESLGVVVTARENALKITGDSALVGQAADVIESLTAAAHDKRPMTREQLLDIISQSSRGNRSTLGQSVPDGGSVDFSNPKSIRNSRANGPRSLLGFERAPRPATRQPQEPVEGSENLIVDVYHRGRQVKALTKGQLRYLTAMTEHDMTFCTGPAGTGKTYLAVAAATSMLRRGEIRKLVLVRPAVEAGEKLGFLPGDLQEKVNPYLRPLFDALHDMMDYDQVQRFISCDIIEICPLAFMRGRTLNDAIIILDEAQNTTKSQMLMFLTRLGQGSKMIITGDVSQVDLEDPRDSGLVDAARRLKNVPGISFVTLEKSDIVRHSLVQKIVEAYGEEGKKV
jgi:phosphate starvation-inducible protein PhoH and related proteins